MGYSLEDVKNRKLDGLVEKVEKMGMEKLPGRLVSECRL